MGQVTTEARLANFKKAGAIIYGTLGSGEHRGERAFVAPYNEGRFGDDYKYYTLPKGAIDAGETPLQGALRETQEETGVDMRKLLTPKGIAQLEKGLPIENQPSGYPGVTIIKANPVPVDHTYLSRAGIGRRTALFSIEITGIEKLRGALKAPQNANRNGTVEMVRQPIRKIIAAEKERFPTFADLQEWLSSGSMPARVWNGNYTGKQQSFPAHEHDVPHGEWFAGLIDRYGPITTRFQWQKFCEKIPPDDYRHMADCIAAIKHQLHDMRILNGDNDHVKLDDKDCPLNYYQEGADIITAAQYIQSGLDRIRTNDDYAKAFGGDCEVLRHTSQGVRLAHSQFVAITPFVSKEDIAKGVDALTDDMSKRTLDDYVSGRKSTPGAPWLQWGKTPRKVGYSLRDPLLAARERLTASWEERTAAEAPAPKRGLG